LKSSLICGSQTITSNPYDSKINSTYKQELDESEDKIYLDKMQIETNQEYQLRAQNNSFLSYISCGGCSPNAGHLNLI